MSRCSDLTGPLIKSVLCVKNRKLEEVAVLDKKMDKSLGGEGVVCNFVVRWSYDDALALKRTRNHLHHLLSHQN